MRNSVHGTEGVIADTRGLSTVEYAVLFVMLLVGTLALWNSIGGQLAQNTEAGAKILDDTMSGAFHRAATAATDQGSGANAAASRSPTQHTRGAASTVNAATRGDGTEARATANNPRTTNAGAPGASTGPAGAASPTAAGAAPVGHSGAAALPQAQTAPAAQQEDKSWYDSARDYVLDSRMGRLGLGVAYGTIGSFVDPLGFAPSPPGAGKDFEVGRAAGEVVTGIAQIYHGGAMVVGGAGLGGVGIAGAVPSAGTSTALIPAAVAAIGVGAAVVTAGLSNAGRGLARGYNAMNAVDDAPVTSKQAGSASDGARGRPEAAARRGGDAPGGSSVRVLPPPQRVGHRVEGLGPASREFSAVDPGPLSDDLAGTFAGGRYREVVLETDTVLHRAGVEGKPLGQFFSTEAPRGVIQTRVDQAVLPKWPGGGTSPIDTAFSVKVPAGTKVYVGPVSAQNGFYVGGTQQVVVRQPWLIEGVEVVGSKGLK